MYDERLLHYVWKHRIFPLRQLVTTDGQSVEVVDTGLYNTDSGPDFFNAKVKIGSTLWVGNVELHRRSSDWFVHAHDRDPRYDNVVLHVAETVDAEVMCHNGNRPPQMQLSVPENVLCNYEELLSVDKYPPCRKAIAAMSRIEIHSWMSALLAERLGQKNLAIERRVERCGGSWEDALFVTLARNYGFGTNGEAFETWASTVGLNHAAHHRDNLFQIEALFFGQAGLLDDASVPRSHRCESLADDYYGRLKTEYAYLAHKFSIAPMDFRQWRFLRMRPQNFPYIRLSQLARLYHSRRATLRSLVEADTFDAVRRLLTTEVTPYWRTHYVFGVESVESDKSLSRSSVDLLVVNTVVPMLFAYGRYKGSERLCDRAMGFLEQLRAEDNTIVRVWSECGLSAENAGDSQALIQLKKAYCDPKECLRCRIGHFKIVSI